MNAFFRIWMSASSLLIGLACFPETLLAEQQKIDFGREVQPILARKCFACHGPDDAHREADLRLDSRAAALESGVIVPGDSENSSLIERIESTDDDLRMPPPSAHETLTDQEKSLLRDWVASGAVYTEHWAFVPPKLPDVPQTNNDDWTANPIDAFVLSRLEKRGLSPAPPAEKASLLRRVSLDLTGLPPTIEEADAFFADQEPGAYERLVDRLLASPRFGEHWGRIWLDLARYSDTNGYEKDRPRNIWPYRDWVIRAINADMPYDQFSIEQLAGDLLPNATIDQKIATGFHRNTMLNEEGGIDPLEYRFYAMVDRVATTGTVWLGMTTGCCQCHSHKYDPISHTDYYRFMALMNNADEPDQILPDANIEKRREQIEEQIKSKRLQLRDDFLAAVQVSDNETAEQILARRYAEWFEKEKTAAVDWKPLTLLSAETNLPRLEELEDGSLFSTGDITKRDVFELAYDASSLDKPITGLRLEVLPDERLPERGPGRAYYEGRKGDFFLSEFAVAQEDKARPFASGSMTYGKISVGSGKAVPENLFDADGSTGWSTSGHTGHADHVVLQFAEPVSPETPLQIKMIFERHFAASLGRFRITATTDSGPLRANPSGVELEATLTQDTSEWNPAEHHQVEQEFLLQTPELAEVKMELDALEQRIPDYPTTLVMEERPEDNPRPTYRHHRGEFLSPRESVTPGLPSLFGQLEETDKPSRLALAEWLVSKENPLAARVAVNRYWQQLFGVGLVSSPGDFGTQSEPPSHPELLDWLATEFVRVDWSRKQLLKTIVMSSTYRQSSDVYAERFKLDPNNRLLSRGPRVRVSAETVRDIMLQASGLLSDKMYGPGVYPPQPKSIIAMAYGNAAWPESQGEDRYRRSLYTFRKRTAPFAAFITFDGPTAETCTVKRDRSNTPLQALTLLNDEMFLEMARAFVKDVQANQQEKEQTLTIMFRRLMTRTPTERELAMLLQYQSEQANQLQDSTKSCAEISGEDSATPEQAAWILTARVLMNLDEAIVKP